ncbi:MAG: 6-bladed beta-propeller [bacterium]|nr:6-bladed beta-propeller [bacterium]
MRHYLTTIMTLLLLVACQGKEEGMVDAIQPGMTLHVPLAKVGSVCELEELFSEWRFVPLETNDSALVPDLKRVQHILLTEGSLYVGDYRRPMQFDRAGGFVRFLPHAGQGPEDYNALNGLVVCPDGSYMILNGGHINRYHVLAYSEEGDLLWKDPFGLDLFSLMDFCQLDARHLAIRTLWGRTSPADAPNLIYIVDMQIKEVVRSFFLNPAANAGMGLSAHFSRYGRQVLLSNYLTTDIYAFTADSGSVRYHVDVDGRNSPEGFWTSYKHGLDLIRAYSDQGYIDHIPFFMESDHRILLYYMGGREELQGYAWIDKQSGEVHSFKQFAFDPSFCWQPAELYPQADGTVVIPIPAHLLFEQEATGLISRFPGLNEESNPVLFIGKLK